MSKLRIAASITGCEKRSDPPAFSEPDRASARTPANQVLVQDNRTVIVSVSADGSIDRNESPDNSGPLLTVMLSARHFRKARC